MRVAVVRFPGSNCDEDCTRALGTIEGFKPVLVWHKESSLAGFDVAVLPGGFSYGDYLRCGAIARFSPIMRAVRDMAAGGGLVVGICNGFQILCEAGLLPGVLIRNRGLRFICEHLTVRVENPRTPFTRATRTGAVLRLPIAHGQGCYHADDETLGRLRASQSVILRYCDAQGRTRPEANPNGSLDGIAGICNEGRNVFGLMPHPERACESALGSEDGRLLFESLRDSA